MPILRECRPSDSAGIAELLKRNPTEEFPLLGLDPQQVEGILRRLQRWEIRLILGLSAAIRRPLIKILVLAESGKILGIAMIGFTPEVAQIGGLTVDGSIQRRGHGQELMKACERIGRRYGRSYLTLDVLAGNLPAVGLYQKLGYRTIRDVRWMSRDLRPPFVDETGYRSLRSLRIRAFRPADTKELVALANAAMPAEVRSVVRLRLQDFRAAGLSRRAGQVEAASWVLERENQIAGYVKAFVSPAVEAAQIGPLVLAQPFDNDACSTLVQTALAWCVERRAPRAILALPEHLDELRPTIERGGFTERFRLHTMALPIGAA